MPGNPTYQKITTNTPLGPIDLNTYTLIGNTATYTVAYSDYSDSMVKLSSPESILDSGRDSAVASVQGKLLGELIIMLDNYPGREFRVESVDGKSTFTARAYLVSHRLYQILIVTPKQDSFSNDVTKFLDSFKLLSN